MPSPNLYETILSRLQRIPLWTRLFVGACTLEYFLSLCFVSSIDLSGALCLEAGSLESLQLWRLITYAIDHVNVIHWFMNAITAVFYLSRFEMEKGTLQSSLLILTVILGTAILYVLFTFVITTYPLFGSSGVLFTLLGYFSVKDASAEPISVGGFFTVPAWLGPGLLYILITLLIPGSSFIMRRCPCLRHTNVMQILLGSCLAMCTHCFSCHDMSPGLRRSTALTTSCAIYPRMLLPRRRRTEDGSCCSRTPRAK